MTDSTRALADRPAATLVDLPDAEVLEREYESEPCWPVTRLVAIALTAALGAGIVVPTAIVQTHGLEWLILLLPAALATLSARALFETIGGATGAGRAGWTRIARHSGVALIPALVAVGVMAASSTVIGSGFTVSAAVATFAVTVLILTVAGGVRDLEIRVRMSMRRVFFVGTAGSRRDLERELSRRRDASLVGSALVDSPAGPLAQAIVEAAATITVMDADAMRRPELVEVAADVNLAGVQIRDLVSYYESEFMKVPLGELSPTWFLFDIAPIHHRRLYRITRRSIEVAFALILLVLSLPVTLAAAAAIKLTSRGAVLYRQRRVGKGGAHFTLVKLRTMVPASGSPAAWAGADANRITPVGRLLRQFRLDELPQLWSVVRGDLALIGPRPEQVTIAERLEQELPHYSARHCVRPGITGWAQVNLGYAGSVEGTIAKLQRDLYYIKHSSLRLDGLILWLTFKTVIAGRG